MLLIVLSEKFIFCHSERSEESSSGSKYSVVYVQRRRFFVITQNDKKGVSIGQVAAHLKIGMSTVNRV